MKCFKHSAAEAVAVCAYCGRAVCRDCLPTPAAARVACSSDCEAALARDAKTLDFILQTNLRNLRATALYCYLGAGLSAGGAIVAWFMLPSPFLILFTAGCAVILALSGLWYGRAARQKPK
jgi:hypothetical protein